DAALLDHALRFRGAGHEVRLPEQMRNQDPARRRLHGELRHVRRHLALAEAAREVGFGALGGGGAVEACHDLPGEARLYVAWMLASPISYSFNRLEGQELDVAPHE